MSNENLILFDDDYSMDEWVMRVEIFVLDVHYYLMLILDMSNLRPELKITTKKNIQSIKKDKYLNQHICTHTHTHSRGQAYFYHSDFVGQVIFFTSFSSSSRESSSTSSFFYVKEKAYVQMKLFEKS